MKCEQWSLLHVLSVFNKPRVLHVFAVELTVNYQKFCVGDVPCGLWKVSQKQLFSILRVKYTYFMNSTMKASLDIIYSLQLLLSFRISFSMQIFNESSRIKCYTGVWLFILFDSTYSIDILSHIYLPFVTRALVLVWIRACVSKNCATEQLKKDKGQTMVSLGTK